MIYTCTLNPAIDLFIQTENLFPETVNRTKSYDVQPNGKGVNVSFILKHFDITNTALGVSGGFTGDYIEKCLQDQGIKTDFTHIEGISRINVFTRVLKDDTEFKQVNNGPAVSPEEVHDFLKKVAVLNNEDILVVSGSFSKGIDPSIIVSIAQMSKRQGFQLIIDTSYKEVVETASYQPLLLKPNNVELMSWFNQKPSDDVEVLTKYAKILLDRGVQNVLVSLGKNGALFVDREQVLLGNAPDVTVVNTACSGDTMLATFLAGWKQKLNLEDNLKRSLAAASSTAGSAGLTDFSDVSHLKKQVQIKVL